MISLINYDDSDEDSTGSNDDLIGPPIPETLKQSEKSPMIESSPSEPIENDEIGPPVPTELQQIVEGKITDHSSVSIYSFNYEYKYIQILL